MVRLADFGAFVEIEEGVEGLIHISQLSTKRVDKPEDVLSEGEEVLARVIEINPAERRMRLSISALYEEEIRKNREEEKKKRLAQKASDENRNKQQPAFHEEEPSVTIGDVLKDFLNR